jgi:hypothetical protein
VSLKAKKTTAARRAAFLFLAFSDSYTFLVIAKMTIML